MVCINTSDSDFNTVKKTGGEKTHTLTINEMPSHNHTVKFDQLWSLSGGTTSLATSPGGLYGGSNYVYNTSGGASHNNLQPYMVVYMWVRTA